MSFAADQMRRTQEAIRLASANYTAQQFEIAKRSLPGYCANLNLLTVQTTIHALELYQHACRALANANEELRTSQLLAELYEIRERAMQDMESLRVEPAE